MNKKQITLLTTYLLLPCVPQDIYIYNVVFKLFFKKYILTIYKLKS